MEARTRLMAARAEAALKLLDSPQGVSLNSQLTELTICFGFRLCSISSCSENHIKLLVCGHLVPGLDRLTDELIFLKRA